MFYVYEWFITDTDEIFYVGKGTKNRYRQLYHRNKLFRLYLDKFNCDVRIIKYFNNEEDAFAFEHKRILELKRYNQAKCNLDYGGIGGCKFIWTDEMREYKSIYNPMKSDAQRERMKLHNPMQNKDIAKRVGEKHRRAVIIDGEIFETSSMAAAKYNVSPVTITEWCRRGVTSSGKKCQYLDGKPVKSQTITYRKPNQKSSNIEVFVDDKLFNSIKSAAEYLNMNSSYVATLLRKSNGYTIIKKHICRYVNQHPSQTNISNSSLEGSTTNE